MKMIGNVSDWLSYAGGALIKVADSAGSTVYIYILQVLGWMTKEKYYRTVYRSQPTKLPLS